jgi:Ca2+-transporting ATPase
MFDRSERLAEEMFTSETKYMITAVTSNQLHGERYYFLKGAPEIVLAMCCVTDDLRSRLLSQIDDWAGEGMRLLGLAYRQSGDLDDYSGYTWVGLLGMEDPVREGVVQAIQIARHAGVQIKMITGDYRRTAEHIARGISLMKDGEQSLEGADIANLTDEELQEEVKHTAVFSRIRPQDKFRIVRALQANGEITAMIGDGVNDAPALKRANIGVVVGNATDVAKETADLILLDNNFRTVVAAIEEGRVIFANIRKVVAYTLSNSFAEVLTIFTAMLLRWPAPLVVAQILWIHLICDGPSDIVLGFEPKESGVMDEKPRSLKAPILTPLALALIGVISITSAIFALSLFGHFFQIHNNPIEGRSIVFASFAINSMVYIFAYRSMRLPLHRMNKLTSNQPLIWSVLAGILTALIAFFIPGLRDLLGIVPLSLEEWGWVAGVALALLAAVEIGKAIANRLQAND